MRWLELNVEESGRRCKLEGSFFSWELIGTVAGATAVVTLIVTVVEYLFGSGINERIRNAIAVVVSIALLVAVEISTGDAAWEDYVLSVLNGLVVALAVLRLYDVTVPRLRSRARGEPIQYKQ